MPRFKRFIDLDLDFIQHPVSNDVTRKYDTSSIIRSVRNLVLTNFYDRPFHPEIGSSVRAMLFENDNQYTRGAIRTAIIATVEQFEPRVENIDASVQLSTSGLSYDVAIFMKATNIIEPVEFNVTLERVR